MQQNIITPSWMRYATTVLALVALAPYCLLPIAWGWRCSALIYALVAWIYTQKCLLTDGVSIRLCGQKWSLDLANKSPVLFELMPNALLFSDWLWCVFADGNQQYHALVTPCMMTERDYALLRCAINLRNILADHTTTPL